MKRSIVVTLAAAALSGSVLALGAAAAPGDTSPPGDASMQREAGGFMLDAHLAGMKAALKLTPDQDKNWTAFESAVRDAAQARRDEIKAMRQAWHKNSDQSADQRPSPIDRMTAMSDRLAKASTEIKAIAEAAKPLYASLDDGQRRHFGPLMATLIEHGRDHGGMNRAGMGPQDGPQWRHGEHRPGQSTED